MKKNKSDKIKKDKNKINVVTITRDNSLIMRQNAAEILVDGIYNFLYALGIDVLRQLNKYKRNTNSFFDKARSAVSEAFAWFFSLIGKMLKELWRALKAPFTGIKMGYRAEKFNIRTSRQNKVVPWSSYGRILRTTGRYTWSIFSTILNYAAPAIALVLLINTIQVGMSQTLVLKVEYKGEDLGYIESEHNFNSALREVDRRLVTGFDTNFTSGAPYFQIVEKTKDIKITSDKALVDGIISASSDDVETAFGFYADGMFMGAVHDPGTITEEIDEIIESSKSGKFEEQIEFDKSIKFSKGLFPKETVISDSKLLEKLNETESTDELYTVKEGDTLSTIAVKMGIKKSMLQDLNPTLTEESLAPGTSLTISKAKKFLSIKTIYTDIYEDDIPYTVITTQNALYASSYSQVESAGVNGRGLATDRVTVVDGAEIDRNRVNMERLSEPIPEQVTVGVDVDPTTSEKGFIWPANGGYIGTVLGGYAGHSGVDINGTGGIGSPIYASASGTVITATYSYAGYGNYVVLQHSDGYVTLYAHCTTLHVNVGDRVAQGQIIATVGSTGNSTGPHLHFEVKQNGQVHNPSNYIGTSP